ncbi:MAG: shikimate kinase [Acholeplasma sp.]|nr:shikimate kinase [Acholeplasma sp.]
MRIYLIGMPGSGKSTIGRMLAQHIGYDFIDLDDYVAHQALMFVDEIIEKFGIDKFRELENKALSEVIGNNVIIACGGGIVENSNNKALMQGIVIYIDVDLKTLEERLKYDYPRPLLKEYTLEELYKKRFLKYQHFADLIVGNKNDIRKTIDDIVKNIEVN